MTAIIFVMFYLLEASHQIQPLLKGRGSLKGVDTRGQGLLGHLRGCPCAPLWSHSCLYLIASSLVQDVLMKMTGDCFPLSCVTKSGNGLNS